MVKYVIDETNYVQDDVKVLNNSTVKFNTEIWNLCVMYVSEAIEAPGIVLSVLFYALFKWKHLWKILHQLRDVLIFPRALYEQLRKASYLAMTYVFVVKYHKS